MKINTWDSSYNQFLVDVSLEYENDLWLETHDKKAPLYKKARCYGQVYIDCLESTRPKIAGKLKNTLLLIKISIDLILKLKQMIC